MKNKKVLALVGALVVLIAVFAVIFTQTRPETTEGSKNITVEVVFEDGSSTMHEIATDEEYLRGALEQEALVEGTDSDYGLYILTVDGITADESLQQWWCVTVGGEMAATGVDEIAIADGDAYEITLVTGW